MLAPKIRINAELLKKAKRHAEAAGYSSVEEFVSHVLEKEMSRLEEAEFERNAAKTLQGLGYIS